MLLTVSLPVYNAMPYLPAAVESILGQSYRDFEFLIIDDCSTDESARMVKEFAGRDQRIRFGLGQHALLNQQLDQVDDHSGGSRRRCHGIRAAALRVRRCRYDTARCQDASNHQRERQFGVRVPAGDPLEAIDR